jgi:hypothetical protein
MDPPVHECPPTLFGEKQQFHTYQLHSWSSLAVNYPNNCPHHRLGTDEWPPLARMTHSGKSSNQYHFFFQKRDIMLFMGGIKTSRKRMQWDGSHLSCLVPQSQDMSPPDSWRLGGVERKTRCLFTIYAVVVFPPFLENF